MKRSAPVMMHVQFDVEISKLGPFTELLQSEVHNLYMKQTINGIYSKEPIKRKVVNPGKRPQPAWDVAVELLNKAGIGGKVSSLPVGNLGVALAKAGLKAISASPLCTRLKAEGYIKYVLPGVCEVIKLPKGK